MGQQPDELLDALALRRVADRYAVAADRRDAEFFAAQFTEDGELIAPRGHFVGREALSTVPKLLERYEKTFHAVLSQVAEISGDNASAETYCIARHFFHDSAGKYLCYEMTIRYQDAFRRIGSDWRFSRRELITDATSTFAVEEHPSSAAGPGGSP